ncbi:MAG TPA: ATP-binding cassette domain-containing protein [Bdellovibrionota bacterium]|nr:ATP-binding cassette domain-containing protein [Bdellovibrionota bacterium]
MTPVIQAKNISRTFRSTQKGEGLKGALGLLLNPQYRVHEALKNVSFTLEPGSFNGLIGANGAGKTTLLKILSGLIPPTTGEARVLGYEPFKRPIDFRRQIALVMGQKAQLWWDLPAIDAFDLLRAIYNIPAPVYRERLHTLTELLDVKHHLNTQIRRLSLGERMKMELIGAILHWPSVIFLDEPTIGLDVLAAHKLREFLRVFNHREKATIILTSHNMDDIERLCSRVLILRSGELIYDGAPGGLLREGERRLRIRFLKTPPLETLSQVTGISRELIVLESPDEPGEEEDVKAEPAAEEPKKDPEERAVYFTIRHEEIMGLLQKLMNQFAIVDMGIEEQSLEAVIQRLYEDEKTSPPEVHS